MSTRKQLSHEDARKGNRALWDEMTPVHLKSYGVDRFLAGEPWLPAEILGEVGPVRGKSLLHLQCHFGLDSLAWVREGAEVTGVDFSPAAITAACTLSAEANLPATFICSDIYELPKVLDQKFDVVFTSIGVLCWLSDLEEWARIIAHALKPGGFFYIMDGHPLLYSLDDEGGWTFYLSYFHNEAPYVWDDPEPDYMDRSYIIQNPSFEWQWAICDIINAVLDAGLTLKFFHEFSVMSEAVYPEMIKREDGLFTFPNMPVELPVIFSLKAQKPETGEAHG
jgi:SAM-dependent methyltransferase